MMGSGWHRRGGKGEAIRAHVGKEGPFHVSEFTASRRRHLELEVGAFPMFVPVIGAVRFAAGVDEASLVVSAFHGRHGVRPPP